MKKYVCFLPILFRSYTLADFRMSAELGEGRVDYSDTATYEANVFDEDGFALASYIGYETDEMLIIDLGLGLMNNFSFFGFGDTGSFKSYEVLFGYRLNFNELYIEPKIGYSKWELTIEDAELTSSDNQSKYQDSGKDAMAKLTAGYMLGRHFGVSVTYKYQDYSHGYAQSVLLGFDFKI